MKVNTIKLISHIVTVANASIEGLRTETDENAIRGRANYLIGVADTLVEMTNAIDDDEAGEEICEVAMELKHDIYQTAVDAAIKNGFTELAFRAAAKRDETTEEIQWYKDA